MSRPRKKWRRPVETREQQAAWARRQLFALAGVTKEQEHVAHQLGLCLETEELIDATADILAGIAQQNQQYLLGNVPFDQTEGEIENG